MAKKVYVRHAKIQKDLTSRLTKGSPDRKTTIQYVLGQGKSYNVKKMSIVSY